MAQKNNTGILTVGITLLLVLGGIGGYLFMQQKNAPVSAEAAPAEQPAAQEEDVPAIDVEAALSDRILGDPSAPVKISEHSSLTCSHCGDFHRNTFKELKSKYIDTGKAYIVFSDFPLNAPALQASMIARCLPHEQYFDFVQMLFETQDDWAYDKGYIQKLKDKSEEAGMDDATFKACINSKDLQAGILNRVQASQTQWQISSTPSFVINNKTVLSGARPIEDFDQAISEAAAE